MHKVSAHPAAVLVCLYYCPGDDDFSDRSSSGGSGSAAAATDVRTRRAYGLHKSAAVIIVVVGPCCSVPLDHSAIDGEVMVPPTNVSEVRGVAR